VGKKKIKKKYMKWKRSHIYGGRDQENMEVTSWKEDANNCDENWGNCIYILSNFKK
jgi:hypothetical protein